MAQFGTIGLVGAGKMATALALAWKERGLAGKLIASDPYPAARESFARATGATVTDENASVLQLADVVILAIKPQKLDEVLAPLRDGVATPKLVISILAGISTARLEKALAYFTLDPDSRPGTPVFNRTITLKDAWVKESQKA